MIMPKRALIFGCMGLASIVWMLLSLWRGEIWSRRGVVISRINNPFQFYVWIFYYALLAALFTGAGVFFFLHPQFSLVPTAQESDD
jgi:hypothetical protein